MIDALLHAATPLLATAFSAWGSPVTWLEVGAFVVALLMVWANLRVHPVAWPLAIASSAAYALLFVHYKLYGEAGLQLVFIALAVWGWWQWLRGTAHNGQPLQVQRLPREGRVRALAATLTAWPLLALLLLNTTDSDVPYFDALPTVASITGQLLLGRKYIENWLVWALVNVISVALFSYKAMWLTAILYALFALLSVVGWRAWSRRLPSHASGAAALSAGQQRRAV